jgi:hypothetical protein
MSARRTIVGLAGGALLVFGAGPLHAQTSEEMKKAAEQRADDTREAASPASEEPANKPKRGAQESAEQTEAAAESAGQQGDKTPKQGAQQAQKSRPAGAREPEAAKPDPKPK